MKIVKEVWKSVKGFENLYEVSNLGRVKSLQRIVEQGVKGSRNYRGERLVPEVIMSPSMSKFGYLHLTLMRDKVRNYFRVHQLVALAFLKHGTPYRKFINHKNGNKLDNRPSNLEWCTSRENKEHASKNGLTAKGETNGNSKITVATVKFIKKTYKTTDSSQQEIANQLGISQALVSQILRGKIWKHVH